MPLPLTDCLTVCEFSIAMHSQARSCFSSLPYCATAATVSTGLGLAWLGLAWPGRALPRL